MDCCHQSRLCCWSLGLKNPGGYRCFGVSLHTATHMGSDRDQGVLMCMSSATGVQQRELFAGGGGGVAHDTRCCLHGSW